MAAATAAANAAAYMMTGLSVDRCSIASMCCLNGFFDGLMLVADLVSLPSSNGISTRGLLLKPQEYQSGGGVVNATPQRGWDETESG